MLWASLSSLWEWKMATEPLVHISSSALEVDEKESAALWGNDVEELSLRNVLAMSILVKAALVKLLTSMEDCRDLRDFCGA